MMDRGADNTLQSLSVVLQTLAFGCVLICLSLLHVSVGSLNVSMMFLPVAILFFWPRQSRYSPAVWSAAAIGLLQDLVSGGPLGIWMLVYTLLFILIDPTVRRVRGGLFSQWSIFAFLIFSTAVLYGLLGRVSAGAPPDYRALAFNALLVVLCFPLMFALRLFLYRASGRDPYMKRGRL